MLFELDELREQHRPLSREPRPITALAGNSMGGTWALWYALAHPERVRGLVLLGSAPLLPGTRPPVPLRVTAAPLVGDLLPHLVKPNRELLIRLMASMSEKDTIVRYPQRIESLVVAARDPINSAANLAELQAIISPFGFRRSARIAPDELRRLTVATLLICGCSSARAARGAATPDRRPQRRARVPLEPAPEPRARASRPSQTGQPLQCAAAA